nr:Nah2 [Starmerella bombicola]
MVWEQVHAEVTTPHISYAVVGFALVLFGTISLFIKERLYIGEATVATIYGLIVGPHCLKWFKPTEWGNTDYITLELSRIVLIVQIFAVAVELPKKYMLRHWWSVTVLLLPVMVFGWVVSSVFIWKLVPTLRWIDALCVAGCVTATDPVLASAVVGKGKFARRVPGHLRNLLSAESGCNDGMAFPFVILAVYIEKYEHHPGEITKEFLCVGILYSCVLGILIGAVIGYGARHLIKFAEAKNLVDRESFLVYYFCVALFCVGVGTLTGTDDLLVSFAAGAAFSWDGWFSKQTEESHVSNVIDVLLNTAFFVYFGAIVPWPDFNNFEIGLKAWKLVCLAIIILVVRRIPIMMAIKPITPDIHTWREALFCGHFGPIGVGALFMCLLARAEIENGTETPNADLLPESDPHYYLVRTIWPITCFLVIASIVVHGSSIAVFTLGKRINNMAVTLTYTTSGNEPSWMSRLPRRSTEGGNVLQLQRMETEEPFRLVRKKKRRLSRPSSMLRRRWSGAAEREGGNNTSHVKVPEHAGFHHSREQREEEQHRPVGENGHHIPHLPHVKDENDIDEEASSVLELILSLQLTNDEVIEERENVAAAKLEGKELSDINTYREGKFIVVEDNEGNVVHRFDIGDRSDDIRGTPSLQIVAANPSHPGRSNSASPNDLDTSAEPDSKADSSYDTEQEKSGASEAVKSRSQSTQRPRRRSIPRMYRSRSQLEYPHSGHRAHAYMIGDLVYVENDDGEILRRYRYVSRGDAPSGAHARAGTNAGIISRLRGLFSGQGVGASSHSDGDGSFKDLENAPASMLIPEDSESPNGDSHSMLSKQDEKQIRQRLSTLLQSGEMDHRPSRRGSDNGLSIGSRMASTIQSQALTSGGEESDGTEYEGEEEAEPETAVERHRRLAALGIIPTDRDEDEEEDPADVPSSNGNGEDEPKIKFMLPKPRRN